MSEFKIRFLAMTLAALAVVAPAAQALATTIVP